MLCPIGDALGLEERLNRLAAEGWELDWTGDGTALFGQFQRTERTELCYHVEIPPLFRDEEGVKQAVERRERDGWEPVGTINGLDVYAAMPCRFPQKPCDLVEQNRNWMPRGILSIILTLAVICLCWFGNFFNQPWYLNDWSVILHLSRLPVTLLGAYWIGWNLCRIIKPVEKAGSPLFFRLRWALLAAFYLWTLCLLMSVVLTVLPMAWSVGTAALGVILVCGTAALQQVRDGRLTKSIILTLLGAVLLLTCVLNLVLEKPHRYSVGNASWRMSLIEMVHREDLTDTKAELLSVEYDKEGSLLVQKETYEEDWADMRLKCKRYSCLTESLAKQVERDGKNGHSGYDIQREGKVVRLLWTEIK